MDFLSEPRLVGAFWGAIYGAAGGAIGGALSALFNKSFRGPLIGIGVFLGFLAPHATDIVAGNLASDAAQSSLVSRSFDRSPEIQRFMGGLRVADPETYDALRTKFTKLATRSDVSDLELMNAFRSEVQVLLMLKLPSAPDDQLDAFAELLLVQLKEYETNNPNLCVKALKQEPLGDVRPFLSKESQDREISLMNDILGNPKSAAINFDHTACDHLLTTVAEVLYEKHGEDLALLDPMSDFTGKDSKVCQLSADFYGTVLSQPKPNSTNILRCLFSQKAPLQN